MLSFPRSSERGPIEAISSMVTGEEYFSFPRSSERGPIVIPVPRPEMPKALHYGLCLSAPLVWPEDKA